jgi:molybdopterin molybdotransferase
MDRSKIGVHAAFLSIILLFSIIARLDFMAVLAHIQQEYRDMEGCAANKMKEFFKVITIDQAMAYRDMFAPTPPETVLLRDSTGRILAADIRSDIDLPDFARSIMDGFAVKGSSTFGASEGNPAYLDVIGSVAMGESTALTVGPGEAVRIATGGMLPPGTDSVVMVEHTEAIDDTTIEVYRSVAPGQNMVEVGEDIKKAETALHGGRRIRPQEAGMLAALGIFKVPVFTRPAIGIISTGDEIVAVDQKPGPGQIRDINTHTLMGLVRGLGATAKSYGIVHDDYHSLHSVCTQALAQCDMILVSGGSSVGARDFTIDVITAMPDSEILFHGVSISPGKPTILARVQNKAFWGLPGHVVSAMVVFSQIVKPFIERISGLDQKAVTKARFTAKLNRNLASAQGRVDFVRVRLVRDENGLWADPILGKSGLINTMVKADGLVAIGMNTEGLEKGAEIEVIPF